MRVTALPQPEIGQHGVAEIEDVKLQLLVRRQVINELHGRMNARKVQAELVFDRPERIGFGNRTGGLQRLGDDAVDQCVCPDDTCVQPVRESGVFGPLRREPQHQRLQHIAVA
ncbi:hypothetical protein D9M70_614530 [compost metagenome]